MAVTSTQSSGNAFPENSVASGIHNHESSTHGSLVTITYSKPDLLPPVYIATSMTDPAWQAIEMTLQRQDLQIEGSIAMPIYSKSFSNVKKGEHHYKFKLGPGDWWVVDHSKPIGSDDQGNQNNTIVIEAMPSSVQSTSDATTAVGEMQRWRPTLLTNLPSNDAKHSEPLPITPIESNNDSVVPEPVKIGRRVSFAVENALTDHDNPWTVEEGPEVPRQSNIGRNYRQTPSFVSSLNPVESQDSSKQSDGCIPQGQIMIEASNDQRGPRKRYASGVQSKGMPTRRTYDDSSQGLATHQHRLDKAAALTLFVINMVLLFLVWFVLPYWKDRFA